MNLNKVVVYDLRMCMKVDNPGSKNIKGDHSREIIIHAQEECPLLFDSQF